MRITLRPQGKEIELPGRRCVNDVLRGLGILPGTALVIRGEELLSDYEMLEAEDCVEIRSVISGGV
jgi:sulfur carrier protein ThiS